MQRGPEQDHHEFEMLLGEMPSVTSGNSRPEESVPLKSYSGLQNHPLEEDSRRSSSPSAFSNFYRSSQAGSPSRNVGFYGSLSPEKLNTGCVSSSKSILDQECHTNGNLDGEKTNATSDYKAPLRIVNPEESNLPDEQSLASALTQLSFKDIRANGQVDPHVVGHNNMPKRTFLYEGKYQNNFDKSYTSFDTQSVSTSTTHDVQDPKKQNSWSSHSHGNLSAVSGEQRQCLPVYTGANPAQSMHPIQVFPSNYVPRVDLSLMPYQQQYFINAQSPISHAHQQQISRSHIPWQHIENDYKLQQQYYLQQLLNPAADAHHPLQGNVAMTNGSINGHTRQPYLKIDNPHQVEQTKEYCFWDTASAQVLDRVGRHNFPEKMLTKSHGFNLLKVISPNPINGSEGVCHVNNEKRLPNDHFHQQCLNSGSFHLDDRFSSTSSPENFDYKMCALRSQPQKYSSLDEVTGSIYHIAKDQHGCRFLQKKFTEGCAEDVDKIFIEIIGHIVELMTDPFGNYLVQKLLEVCTNEQKTQILHAITRKPGELVRISLDMHGTRAVQKVIETLKTPEQFTLIVNSLKPGIVSLMKDTNGNHVAQRCLQHLLPEYKEYLFEDAISHCIRLAKDRHACCVLQKCLSHCDGEHRRRLVCGITSDALNLSQNQYGNYVVQYVFELRLPWATANVLDKLEGSYGYLSVQKYSSNVVEKCLKFAGEDRRSRIVQELIIDSRLDQILQDPYGNYVIQAALSHSKGAVHAALVESIRPHVPALRTSPYGKKILSSNGLKK